MSEHTAEDNWDYYFDSQYPELDFDSEDLKKHVDVDALQKNFEGYGRESSTEYLINRYFIMVRRKMTGEGDFKEYLANRDMENLAWTAKVWGRKDGDLKKWGFFKIREAFIELENVINEQRPKVDEAADEDAKIGCLKKIADQLQLVCDEISMTEGLIFCLLAPLHEREKAYQALDREEEVASEKATEEWWAEYHKGDTARAWESFGQNCFIVLTGGAIRPDAFGWNEV